ncbi:MAG: hypothetical protein GXO43_01590 [Crenarchaeota archaeon]|nr:hypothetical protein [Thermoproteota archaeon]
MVETYHFKFDDVLIRSVTIDIYPERAVVRYILNAPPVKNPNNQTLFTGINGPNYLEVDLENYSAVFSYETTPQDAIQLVLKYKIIALETYHSDSA